MDPYAASNFMPLQILQGPSLYISSCGPKREHLRDCWVIGHSTYIFTGHLLPDCSLFSDPPRVRKSISNPCQHLNLFSLLVFISLMVQNYKRIFFFSFLASLRHMEFPGLGSDLCCSCGNARSFNPLCWAGDQTHVLALQKHHQSCWTTVGTPCFILFIFLLYLWHVEFPEPRIEPTSQQWLELLQ